MAVDLGEASVAKPPELLAEPCQPVTGIVALTPNLTAEALVLVRRGRGDQLQVRKDAPRCEQLADLAEQRALALVLEMVDREPGDDRVEASSEPERPPEIVSDELDQGVILEALRRAREHRLGDVYRDSLRARMARAHQRRKAPVAGPKVEKSPDRLGQRFEQHPLGRLAMWDLA